MYLLKIKGYDIDNQNSTISDPSFLMHQMELKSFIIFSGSSFLFGIIIYMSQIYLFIILNENRTIRQHLQQLLKKDLFPKDESVNTEIQNKKWGKFEYPTVHASDGD